MAEEQHEFNAGDDRHVKRRERKAKFRQEQKERALGSIMASIEGRVWMFDLLSKCGCYRLSFVHGEPDTTAFNEGSRKVGNEIMDDIMRIAPEQYIRMITEQEQKNG
jgi:hypothetical protein